MANRDKLSDAEIAAFIAANPGWARVERAGVTALARTFAFEDYTAGIAFAVQVGFAAEALNHHPDIFIGWRRVEVVWSTHDAGGVTELDADLARRTDVLAR